MLACAEDFKLLLEGEPAKFDWGDSLFSSRHRPKWFTGIPVSLHYLGGRNDDEFLDRSVALGQALNDLNGAANTGTYSDIIYFIKAMRYDNKAMLCVCGRVTISRQESNIIVAYVEHTL